MVKARLTNNEIDQKSKLNKRDTWTSKFDFLLACVGFSIGLGNVWRFPYLCYKNGGGAFLIPYFICVLIGGIPLFYLEIAIGQFMGVCGLEAWNICPLLQGIGIATTVIEFFLACYYNIIMCWAFYYMFSSFTSNLPWASCDNEWNTDRCSLFVDDKSSTVSHMNSTVTGNHSNINDTYSLHSMINSTATSIYSFSGSINLTDSNISSITPGLKLLDPVTEFWEKKVLGISDGIEYMGSIKWDLALTLLFAWIVVYLCICKGIKSSGKVLYVTATSPYLFMTALLIRNSLLDGAGAGVEFYLKPNMTKLWELEVWVDAGTQIFFSYSIANGGLTALGSFNQFHHNTYKDCLIFALTNSGTSFFSGFIIFTVLGHMAFLQNTTVDKVAASGPGLAFIAYPKAVSMMPAAPVWSVLFFLMIAMLGLDSQFVTCEALVMAVVDQWPHILRRGYRKEVFVGVVCFVCFLIGLSMVAEGGMYVFQLFDYYSSSRSIIIVAFIECAAIAWVYGINRFYDNIEMMLGFRISKYMWVNWTILSPLYCMAIFIMSAISYVELDYRRPDELYVYPGWAVGIGWFMAGFPILFVPVVALYKLFKYGRGHSYIEVARRMVKPYGLKEHQLREQDINEKTLADFEDRPERNMNLTGTVDQSNVRLLSKGKLPI